MEKPSCQNLFFVPADLKVLEYAYTSSRTISDVESEVTQKHSAKIRSFFDKFEAGERIFDSGGGFSLYGIELAQKGVEVTTVSLHNFYDKTLFSGINQGHYYLNKKAERFLLEESFTGHLGSVYSRLKKIVPLSIQRSTPVKEVLPRIAIFIKELEQSGLFIRKISNSYDELAKLPDNSLDGFIDFVGAFYYSSNRLDLINLALRKLKPGGKGLIWVDGQFDYVGIYTFFSYLESLFPETFEYLPARQRGGLLFKKKNIDLHDYVEIEKADNQFDVPKIQYKSKNH